MLGAPKSARAFHRAFKKGPVEWTVQPKVLGIYTSIWARGLKGPTAWAMLKSVDHQPDDKSRA